MAESSLRSRAKNRRHSAQVDVSPDEDEDGHPQQDPVRLIQLPLAQKACCTYPQSLGCSHPTRIGLRVSRSEHDSRRCSHCPRICITLLQNQPPRPSSVRAARLRSPSTPDSPFPILALTKFTLGNLRPIIFYGNTTLTYTHHSQNSFLASLAGSLVLMVSSTSRTLAMTTRKITSPMLECVLSPQSSVVSPSPLFMGS